jgi:hypothetical protein
MKKVLKNKGGWGGRNTEMVNADAVNTVNFLNDDDKIIEEKHIHDKIITLLESFYTSNDAIYNKTLKLVYDDFAKLYKYIKKLKNNDSDQKVWNYINNQEKNKAYILLYNLLTYIAKNKGTNFNVSDYKNIIENTINPSPRPEVVNNNTAVVDNTIVDNNTAVNKGGKKRRTKRTRAKKSKKTAKKRLRS